MKEFPATSPGLTQKLNSYPSVLLATPFISIFGSIPPTPLSLGLISPFFSRKLNLKQLAYALNEVSGSVLSNGGLEGLREGVKKVLKPIASGKSVIEFINETTVRITAPDALTLLKAVFE